MTELAHNYLSTTANGPRDSKMRKGAKNKTNTPNFLFCKGRREGVYPHIARALLIGTVGVSSVPFF